MGFIGDAVGAIGGAVGDVFGKVGNQFGFQGGANQYRSTPPVNTFHATGGQPPSAASQGGLSPYAGGILGRVGGSPSGGWGFGGGSAAQDPGPYNAFQAQGFQATPFQASQANLQNTNFAGALQGAMGQPGPGGGVGQQQGQFADMLRQQIAGNGPSLAQQQLLSALQQNQQGAASAIGSQRGINPALASRLIGQNQAMAGQQAAGQSAMLRSQEQLNAQGMLGQALQAQRGQDILGQQAQTGLIGTLGGLQQGQNALALQNSLGTQGLNLQGSLGAQGLNLQGLLGQQGMNLQAAMQNAQLGQGAQEMNLRAALANQQANLGSQQINAGVSGQNAGISSGSWGGLLNAGGGALGKMMAGGGEVPTTFALDDPTSYIGLKPKGDGLDLSQIASMVGPALAAMQGGGAVPGQAVAAGNSPRNDTVPIQASPGEIVLPRSVTKAEDAPEKAAAFVRALQRHERQKDPGGYGNVLARVRELQQGLKQLEGMFCGGKVKA